MYPNQAFSSGSYADMYTVTPLLPHNCYNESLGEQNEAITTMQSIDEHSNACNSHVDSDQNIHQCHGLSLSLGTLLPSTASVSPFQYQYHDTGFVSLMNACLPNLNGTSTTLSRDDDDNMHKELESAECMPTFHHDITKREGFRTLHPSDQCFQGSQGFSNIFLNSQYLKATQELLDEIVNVRKALKQHGMEKQEKTSDIGLDNSKDADGKETSHSMQMSSGPNGDNSNSCCELSPAERQNLLDKKTKLLSMLDEVDKRYRQYCHHMQTVVSSLDMVAGCGAAEPYTSLALRTISRHFRCLRDAISSQIQVIQRNLGEQEGIPRLRYVDQHLRQQKALQHLGVMRQAWRPQRGLPENSVSILRAWLFEHFLNPYPKDSEKIMLARQTGLTRNQVANWFINARVRLWKPMVEEIYKEEFSDSKRDCVQEFDNNNKSEESHENNVITSDNNTNIQAGQFHGLKSEQTSSTTEQYGEKRMQGNQRLSAKNGFYSSSGGTQIASDSATYELSELGNFSSVGGHHHVSLALELRNCESDVLAISDDAIQKRHNNHNQTLASSSDSDLLDYHFTDSGKQQHRFGNTHLLHEFVV